jgi:hypothetical protein
VRSYRSGQGPPKRAVRLRSTLRGGFSASAIRHRSRA